MTFVERMDVPKTVTLPEADWWVIQGLLTKEWSDMRDAKGREPYYKNLTKMRQAIQDRK